MKRLDIALNSIALDPLRWKPGQRPYYSLVDLLPSIDRAGFHQLEIWQYHVSTLSEAEFKKLATELNNVGISVRAVGIYPQLHHAGDDRDSTWNEYRSLMDRSRRLGAEKVKLFVGSVGSNEISEDDRRRTLSMLVRMASLASEAGIELTGETHANTLFDTTDSALTVLSEIDQPNFKICFQPYDFDSTQQAIADLEALSPYITHVHFQGRKASVHSLLSEADLDYARIVDSIGALDIQALWSIEFVKGCVVDDPADFDLESVLGAARQDHDFLMDCARKVGA